MNEEKKVVATIGLVLSNVNVLVATVALLPALSVTTKSIV